MGGNQHCTLNSQVLLTDTSPVQDVDVIKSHYLKGDNVFSKFFSVICCNNSIGL